MKVNGGDYILRWYSSGISLQNTSPVEIFEDNLMLTWNSGYNNLNGLLTYFNLLDLRRLYYVTKEYYQELGSDYFDNRRQETTSKRLAKRLEQLGYSVSL